MRRKNSKVQGNVLILKAIQEQALYLDGFCYEAIV